ncbi:hypothetical protein BKA70DRAFT_1441748 [Coprinopsis sp. MPI-PUGE-AT-0042]|nr:hypothetical protein BKA70DRAFT_1441748 [Coprinopsis sp. MPI-PUGE-AT-0042]
MSSGLDTLNSSLSDGNVRGRSPIDWYSTTVIREGAGSGSQLPEAQTCGTLGVETPGSFDTAESTMVDNCYFATSRRVTVIKQCYEDMTKEEIIRAKDVVIIAQKQRIERLRRRMKELKEELYAGNRVQALTMDILDLSLEPDMEVVL